MNKETIEKVRHAQRWVRRLKDDLRDAENLKESEGVADYVSVSKQCANYRCLFFGEPNLGERILDKIIEIIKLRITELEQELEELQPTK
jgi:hypothetical protein